MLAFERLDVYRVAVEFDEVVTALAKHRGGFDVEHLDRATGSVLRNIAEGATERRPAEKARLFRLALREAAECGSALDRVHRRHSLPALTYARARSHIERIQQMLNRLVTRYSTPPR